jgi:hypothetical protein
MELSFEWKRQEILPESWQTFGSKIYRNKAAKFLFAYCFAFYLFMPVSPLGAFASLSL